MFIDTLHQTVVIIGGGHAALCKARLLARSDAELKLLSDATSPELAAFARQQGIEINDDPSRLRGARLTFVATGCPGADAAWVALARAQDRLVNCVDRQQLCDMLTPALVDRAPLVIAIGTEGSAPVLAQKIRQKLELELNPVLGHLAAISSRLRALVASQLPQSARRSFWRWVFSDATVESVATCSSGGIAQVIKSELDRRQDSDALASTTIENSSHLDLASVDVSGVHLIELVQNAGSIVYQSEKHQHLLDFARRDAVLITDD